MGETTEHAKRVVDLIREYNLEDVRKFPCAAHYVMGIAARKIERITAQLEQTENKLTELLSYATGGRFSKADYSIDDMRRFVDDYNQSTCNECDELEQAEKERDGLNIMLAQAQAMLETRTKERDAYFKSIKGLCATCRHAVYCMLRPGQCPDGVWQWRGVQEVEHGI